MSWMLFPENPALSAIVLFAILLPFLYAAREPAHRLFAGNPRLSTDDSGVRRRRWRRLASSAACCRLRAADRAPPLPGVPAGADPLGGPAAADSMIHG